MSQFVAKTIKIFFYDYYLFIHDTNYLFFKLEIGWWSHTKHLSIIFIMDFTYTIV